MRSVQDCRVRALWIIFFGRKRHFYASARGLPSPAFHQADSNGFSGKEKKKIEIIAPREGCESFSPRPLSLTHIYIQVAFRLNHSIVWFAV